MRKLASIQKVLEVKPHSNADKLDVIRVLGWTLCAAKGDFKPGDPCVYCEVDSVMPQRPEFEFLRPRNFRIKTIKLRGTISQGIAFKVDLLPLGDYVEGQDVTDLLAVTKYEPPLDVCMLSDVKGYMPGFLPKTDETRIQSVPNVLIRWKGVVFDVTEKLDGQSMTVYHYNNEVGVCGRTMEFKPSVESAMWRCVYRDELDKRLLAANRNIALQGEFIGPKVQGNKYNLTEHQFRVYNFFNIDTQEYRPLRSEEALLQQMGVKSVPYLSTLTLGDQTIEELVKTATFRSTLNPQQWAEGLVLRPALVEFRDEELGRLSFKIINPEYLLEEK
ncbi:MAG: RNA ligase (ATP) [Nitrosomonadaceae bacterium]|nr:RNA ligase (ATP) [Nitrosomonadaceae bacterium]